MRALLFAAVCAVAAWAPRAQPYRFSMPMLGQADVPPATLLAPLRKPVTAPRAEAVANTTKPRPRHAYGWQIDAQAGIRTASAKGIELAVPEASAESAAAVRTGVVYSRLPAPNKPAPTGLLAPIDLPGLAHIREPSDLRGWVGRRDKREPHALVLAWLTDLGIGDDELRAAGNPPEVATWAARHERLLAPAEVPQPGDVLVFDRAVANEPRDLIALVIGRDTRGVIEFVYAAGGVIRRGFVDVAHPTQRRDLTGGVMNTFLRHGKQWPPKGTRYLSGELLAHVIRVH
jgi:hypothetical protein